MMTGKKITNGLTVALVAMGIVGMTVGSANAEIVADIAGDWVDATAVLDKVQEEIDELREAMAARVDSDINEEMGDVLFSCVNLARHLGLDAESSLRSASAKFEQRFGHMESVATTNDTPLAGMDQGQFDSLWEQAKRAGLRQR